MRCISKLDHHNSLTIIIINQDEHRNSKLWPAAWAPAVSSFLQGLGPFVRRNFFELLGKQAQSRMTFLQNAKWPAMKRIRSRPFVDFSAGLVACLLYTFTKEALTARMLINNKCQPRAVEIPVEGVCNVQGIIGETRFPEA